MKCYIGSDGHKKYSVFATMDENGKITMDRRVGHEREVYCSFLRNLPPCSPIALETIGNWYWMVDEMERAGHVPLLTHAGKAKDRMSYMREA